MKIPNPTFNKEVELWKSGIDFVIGLDEVGRGAFAGPLVAAGVVFSPFSYVSPEIHDSKLLRAAKRQELASVIKQQAMMYAFSEISVSLINRIGIGKANYLAFRQIVQKLFKQCDREKSHILVDGLFIQHLGIRKSQQTPIIKGDQTSLTIAAASIIAKVHRDMLMTGLAKTFGSYGFETNKGYGTLTHRAALTRHGLSPVHRTAFCSRTLDSLPAASI